MSNIGINNIDVLEIVRKPIGTETFGQAIFAAGSLVLNQAMLIIKCIETIAQKFGA